MKALSIRQPWAWLIVQGFKPVENRTWPTAYRGEFLIHAGKQWDRSISIEEIEAEFKVKVPANLPLGGVVGKANLVDCVTEFDSEYFFGPYGFVLEKAQPLTFRKATGRLGFFNLPEVDA